MEPLTLISQEDDGVRQALFNLNNWAMIASKALEDLPEDYTMGRLVVINRSELQTELQKAVTLVRDRYFNFLTALQK